MGMFDWLQKRDAGHHSETVSNTVEGSKTTGFNWLDEVLGNTQPEIAAKFSAVYHCVDVISNAVAIMPLVYKRKNAATGVMQPYIKNDKDRLNWLLNYQPNERMNAYDFKKMLVAHKLLWGNAFVLPVDANGYALSDFDSQIIDRLVLIHPDTVTYDKRTNKYEVSDTEQWVRKQKVFASQIFHFKNQSYGMNAGFWGESVLHYALTSLKIGMTTDNEILHRSATGGRGKYLLNYTDSDMSAGRYADKQVDDMGANLERDIAKKDVISMKAKQMQLSPLSMSSADMKLLEVSQVSERQIANFFNVPMFFMGEQSSNYKTPDAAYTMLQNYCVAAHCVQIQTEIMSKYCNAQDWTNYSMDFDEEARLKLDVESQSKKDLADLTAGICTLNELRARHGMAPVVGGDVPLLSANLKAITTLAAEGEKQNVEPKAKAEGNVAGE